MRRQAERPGSLRSQQRTWSTICDNSNRKRKSGLRSVHRNHHHEQEDVFGQDGDSGGAQCFTDDIEFDNELYDPNFAHIIEEFRVLAYEYTLGWL